MSVPRPVAIGYVCGADDSLVKRQHADVTRYIEAEGLALAEILHDTGDGFTISQIVQAAQLRHARQVVLPADARLVVARNRLIDDLAEHGAVCVVLDQPDPKNTDPGASARPVPILARSRPAGSRPTKATP
ncbi:hypothetical protein [Promicromonospora soli]